MAVKIGQLQVILIIGYPGSGKTYLGKMIVDQRNAAADDCGWVLIDDPKSKDVFQNTSGKNLVITDPKLCDPKNRNAATEYLKKRNYNVTSWFFEANIHKCLKNIRHRDDGRYICSFSAFNYVIPENVAPLIIWQPPSNDK